VTVDGWGNSGVAGLAGFAFEEGAILEAGRGLFGLAGERFLAGGSTPPSSRLKARPIFTARLSEAGFFGLVDRFDEPGEPLLVEVALLTVPSAFAFPSPVDRERASSPNYPRAPSCHGSIA